MTSYLLRCDIAIELFLNQFVNRVPWLDRIAGAVVGNYLLGGMFLLACVCYLWFRRDHQGRDERLIIAREFMGVCLSAPLSRALQLVLQFHPRPFNDPSIPFVRAVSVVPENFSHWSSFPSDHASVYFALFALIISHSKRLGLLALISASVAVFPRIYLGYHWPSDIAGGILVGCLCVWLCRRFIPERFVARILRWEDVSPAYFNAAAFILCYELGTLFDDVRHLGTAALHFVHGR